MEEKVVTSKIQAVKELRIKVLLAHQTNYSRTKRDVIDWIVIHATAGHEGPMKDFDEAMTISKELPKGKRRSFHYVCDSDSATRCVPDLLTAWHCGATGNKRGIGVEICGRCEQTREQWLDAVSLPTLNITARLIADLCKEHRVPAVYVDEKALKAGYKGITTHAAMTAAFGESTHWDPGPGFPLQDFVEAVSSALVVTPLKG